MRRLSYQYYMLLSFSEPVNRQNFTLRCFPQSDERQQIEEQHIEIRPSYVGGTETDSYGNRCVYGFIENRHTEFGVDVTGTATVRGEIFLPAGDSHRTGMYRYPTTLTKPGPVLRKLYDDRHAASGLEGDPEITELQDICSGSSSGILQKAVLLMDRTHRSIKYVPGVTQITTTAEESAALGMGVCQDYAHIMLALLRMEKIPCRYIVGMMLGEGASHAWVEVCDGMKWVPLDPTHNRLADDRYICISRGRDAGDCSLNKGYYYGSSNQVQEVHVVVEDLDK